MSIKCKHIFRDKRLCSRKHGPQFDACTNHRAKPAARPSYPCVTCGKQTTVASGQCCRLKCPGITQYRQVSAANRIKASEALHKLVNRTPQEEIKIAEDKLAQALDQIEVFKAHIEALKARCD
jgi:hypothetical protein